MIDSKIPESPSPVKSLCSVGETMVIGGCENGTLLAWDISNGNFDSLPASSAQVVKLLVYKDFLLVAYKAKAIDVFNTASGFEKVHTIQTRYVRTFDDRFVRRWSLQWTQ